MLSLVNTLDRKAAMLVALNNAGKQCELPVHKMYPTLAAKAFAVSSCLFALTCMLSFVDANKVYRGIAVRFYVKLTQLREKV